MPLCAYLTQFNIPLLAILSVLVFYAHFFQITSKNVFIVVVVVVAVVVLITAVILVLLFYLRSNEDKLKMLDFDNQLNANGSYRELCRQRYDAKSSERLLGSNGDAPKVRHSLYY